VRKSIPPQVEAEVLLKSARRCALCFHLNSDLGEKLGQIAHVNQDPSDSSEDNLVWLCLDHHTVRDSRTSQHKNYTVAEVKAARARLYSRIAQGNLCAPSASAQSHTGATQISYGPGSPNFIGSNNTVANLILNQERRLSEAQKVAMSSAMSQYKGYDGSGLMWCVMGDAESTRFAMDFVDSLRRAGWLLPNYGLGQGMYPPSVVGLVVQYASDDHPPPQATAFIRQLSKMGIGGVIEVDPGLPADQFRIIVGRRP